MLRLDAEERAALEARPQPALQAAEIVAYLQDLERLWADAPQSRKALAEALFDGVDVLGLRSITVTPSAEALRTGLAEAFHSGTHVYGRGGGIRTHDFFVPNEARYQAALRPDKCPFDRARG